MKPETQAKRAIGDVWKDGNGRKPWRVQCPKGLLDFATRAEAEMVSKSLATRKTVEPKTQTDLLEALKDMICYAESYYRSLPDDGPAQDFIRPIIDRAITAIAKAEGKDE